MRIGIVFDPYSRKNQSGLGRYIFEVTKNLLKEENVNNSSNEYTLFFKKENVEKFKINYAHYKNIFNYKAGLFWMDRVIYGNKLDFCIFPTPIMTFLGGSRKNIITVHDLWFKIHKSRNLKELFTKIILTVLYQISFFRAYKIVCVSHSTKESLINNFFVNNKKIRVIYNGLNSLGGRTNVKGLFLPKKFTVFVGGSKERKNLLTLIRSFNDKSLRDLDIKLVVIGGMGSTYFEDIKSYISNNNLSDKIIFLGRKTDEEISYIYSKAMFFIYPSVCEGFGMTVLEAMGNGLPVLISDIDVFRELFSNSALFFNPYDEKDLSKKIIFLYKNDKIRLDLAHRSAERSRDFSWKKTARGFIEIMND